MIAVGIDLAVQASKTGVCVLRKDSDGKTYAYFDSRRNDEDLAALIYKAWEAKPRVPVAIDVPLGWSPKFRDFLQDPSSEESKALLQHHRKDYRYIDLRLRQADQDLHGHLHEVLPKPTNWGANKVPSPLSASTDKLGAATMRWFAIRAAMKDTNAADHVLETYPAAARYVWEWPDRKHLGDDVEALIRDDVSWDPSRRQQDPYKATEHERDALVASLVARLDVGERRGFPGKEFPSGEGCIWIPEKKSKPPCD